MTYRLLQTDGQMFPGSRSDWYVRVVCRADEVLTDDLVAGIVVKNVIRKHGRTDLRLSRESWRDVTELSLFDGDEIEITKVFRSEERASQFIADLNRPADMVKVKARKLDVGDVIWHNESEMTITRVRIENVDGIPSVRIEGLHTVLFTRPDLEKYYRKAGTES